MFLHRQIPFVSLGEPISFSPGIQSPVVDADIPCLAGAHAFLYTIHVALVHLHLVDDVSPQCKQGADQPASFITLSPTRFEELVNVCISVLEQRGKPIRLSARSSGEPPHGVHSDDRLRFAGGGAVSFGIA